MLTYEVLLTKSENEIINLIYKIQYGTISNLEILPGQPSIRRELSLPMKSLIDALREHKRFVVIQVHQSEPTYVDVMVDCPGNCIKHIKL